MIFNRIKCLLDNDSIIIHFCQELLIKVIENTVKINQQKITFSIYDFFSLKLNKKIFLSDEKIETL